VHGLAGSKGTPTHLIYGLIDPRTRFIRYIGKSSSGPNRPKQHARTTLPNTKPTSTTHCQRWIHSLQKLQLSFEIVILEVLDGQASLDEAECWWIAFGRACGWRLTNHHEGGVPTAETLAKIAERQKQKIERAAQVAAEKQHRAEEKHVLARRACSARRAKEGTKRA
jgi:hypothetical protein